MVEAGNHNRQNGGGLTVERILLAVLLVNQMLAGNLGGLFSRCPEYPYPPPNLDSDQ